MSASNIQDRNLFQAKVRAATEMRDRAADLVAMLRSYADRDNDKARHFQEAADILEPAIRALPLTTEKSHDRD